MTRLFAGTAFDIPPRCDDCGELRSDCACTAEQKAAMDAKRKREAQRLPPEQQTARVSVQKRKGGRQATDIEGLTAEANDLPALLSTLQADCGTGGTVKPKDDLLELQGDHASAVRQSLARIGYRVK